MTWREITNGSINTQAIEREFNNHTKITNVCLIVKGNKSYLCLYYVTGCAQGQEEKRDNEDGGIQYFRSVSRYDINNAFLKKNLPFSDNVYEPYKMMPLKLLHTSGSFKLLCH